MPRQYHHTQTLIKPLLLLPRHELHIYISYFTPSHPTYHSRTLLRSHLRTEHPLILIEHTYLPLS